MYNVVEGFYYLCSENKGADQLRSYCAADLRLCFCICKNEAHTRMFRVLTQTPNATRNEAEFDRSRFSMKTKKTNISQNQSVNILKPLVFVCR